MVLDNARVPTLWSAVVCNIVVASCAICAVDEFLRGAFAGLSKVVLDIGDFALDIGEVIYQASPHAADPEQNLDFFVF